MTREEILKKHAPLKENILMILHDLQNNNPDNWLSKDDLGAVAAHLNTTLSSVLGVATYYSMYSIEPRGKIIIRVCNSPVCNMVGSEGIIETLKRTLGIEIGETTADGLFTLELTECLGRCAAAPGLIANEDFHGVLDEKRVEQLIDKLKR